MPQVSVVMPVFNGEAFLEEALDSVLAQTFADWELIVVNDGSRDGTAAIAERYAEKDRRIRVITQSNRGLAASRGVAVAAAQGALVAFLDADDVWLEHKLQRQVEAAAGHPECAIITSDALSFDVAGVVVPSLKTWYKPGSGDVLDRLLFGNFIPPSAAMARRGPLLAVSTYDVPPPGYGEDWLMWMQIAARAPIHFVDEVLVRRRIHDGAMSSQAADIQFQCLMRNFAIVRERIPRLSPRRVDQAVFQISWNRGWRDITALRLKPAQEKLAYARAARPWAIRPRLAGWGLRWLPEGCWRLGKRMRRRLRGRSANAV